MSATCYDEGAVRRLVVGALRRCDFAGDIEVSVGYGKSRFAVPLVASKRSGNRMSVTVRLPNPIRASRTVATGPDGVATVDYDFPGPVTVDALLRAVMRSVHPKQQYPWAGAAWPRKIVAGQFLPLVRRKGLRPRPGVEEARRYSLLRRIDFFSRQEQHASKKRRKYEAVLEGK